MNGTKGGLRRELGLGALAVYGIGGMLGGGIYALVGEVAGLAGSWCWLAFLIAMAVAAPTALTYSALAARYPRSGGEAWFCRQAFGGDASSFVVGWLVLFSGLVSMAALSRAFASYARDLVPNAPIPGLAVAFLAVLGILNVRGIRLASATNVLCTFVEVSGLVAIVVIGARVLLGAGPEGTSAAPAVAAGNELEWGALMQGAALAFYAFIGFEDMVNVAEETREPERAFPIAIPLALLVVGTVYALVSFVSTRVVSPDELASADAPLSLVVERGTDGFPPEVLSVVALFAVANSALLNFVMVSRLAHGMAGDGLLPGWIGRLHARWSTPHLAILVLFVMAAVAATTRALDVLAGATSALLLAVFFTVNLAAVVLQRRESTPRGLPSPVPWIGMITSVALAWNLPGESVQTALPVVLAGLAVAGLRGLRRRRG